MKKLIFAAFSAAVFSASPVMADDCQPVIERIASTAARSQADPIELLKLVDIEVTAQPGCACEIVKAAILGTNCDNAIVGYVVETAIHAAPDQMRLIAQCAIATAPGALDRVQEVLARLDPGAGETAKSAKSAKSAKDIEVKPAASTLPDPLDVPIISIPPIPPVINPPPSTRANFGD